MPPSKADSALLTRREREIMNAVFALGNRALVDDIRARLTNPPSDSAVRAMLVRLENKGFLKHQYDGPRYVYSRLFRRLSRSARRYSSICRLSSVVRYVRC